MLLGRKTYWHFTEMIYFSKSLKAVFLVKVHVGKTKVSGNRNCYIGTPRFQMIFGAKRYM